MRKFIRELLVGLIVLIGESLFGQVIITKGMDGTTTGIEFLEKEIKDIWKHRFYD